MPRAIPRLPAPLKVVGPLLLWSAFAYSAPVDLGGAVVVAPEPASSPERKAVAMLVDEVQKRTQIRWDVRAAWPDDRRPTVVIGTRAAVGRLKGAGRDVDLPAGGGPAEGYHVRVARPAGDPPAVWVVGNDTRGVLYGVGHLLRKMEMTRQSVTLAADPSADAAPQTPLRGHQLGYRPKTNSYDGWTVAMWEQYLRDLVVFGCNAVELIPPRSDDAPDSPHFPLPQIQMMAEVSRLAGEYGLSVWVWYPAMDADYSDPATVEFALKEWAGVFARLPRIDAVFVPGGDPGHTRPKHLLALLEKQSQSLNRFHPRAQMWVSPQSFTRQWMDEFLELLRAEPRWLSGVVYGPQVRMPLPELRRSVPGRYPIRDYPDITHSRTCQYPVPQWDLAFALTEAREPINPRPTQMAAIVRWSLPHAAGFITYSEGCNDDVNKMVWSALGWDREADVRDVLRDYGRYFIDPRQADDFAQGLLDLERNWEGPAATNTGIEDTLRRFQAMERAATPRMKLNWRFQQALYRAYYDAYERARLLHEAATEAEALRVLGQARETGPLKAVAAAQDVLGRPPADRAALELRARVFELGEALFQSIRMQLSVPKYQGMPGRGNNLDTIDTPLNNRLWLTRQFDEIRGLPDDAARLAAIDLIVRREDPGPGGFYDRLGDPRRSPHLVRGVGFRDDPGFYRTPQVGFPDPRDGDRVFPTAWWHAAESLYDEPVRLHYAGLDPTARYTLRVVYGKSRNNAPVRAVAGGADGAVEVHPPLNRPGQPLEFPVPLEATRTGELDLSFIPESGRGGNGRSLQVCEVWLVRR